MNLPSAYGDRVRVRVGALIFDDRDEPDRLLLVKHAARDGEQTFWTPPGGGVEFGESLPEALRREVAEETGLQVSVDDLIYALDFVRPPLHAVSFYFRCHREAGTLTTGFDPELEHQGQFIDDVQFISFNRFNQYRIIPEGLGEDVRKDVQRARCAGTARYLGTKR